MLRTNLLCVFRLQLRNLLFKRLVGVPIHNSTEINALVNGTHANGKRLASTFEMLEPQEVDILGSLRASTCVYFNT